MQIHIEDYRNIKELDLEIEDRKINLLTGISGCGKTSIAYALRNPSDSQQVRAGSRRSEPVVEVVPPGIAVEMFNVGYETNLYVEQSSNGVYKAIMRKGDALLEAEREYQQAFHVLSKFKDKLRERERTCTAVITAAQAKFRSGNKVNSSCTLGRICTSVKESSEQRLSLVRERDGAYLSWLLTGMKQEEWRSSPKSCPFCHNEDISQERLDELESYAEGRTQGLDKIPAIQEALHNLGMDVPDLYTQEGSAQLNETMEDFDRERSAIVRILEVLEPEQRDMRKGESFNLSTLMEDVALVQLKGLGEAAESLRKRSQELDRCTGILKSKFRKTVSTNSAVINDYLSQLDIPYTFEDDGINPAEGRAAYVLMHIDADERRDYKNELSFGEKNLVALMLFLLCDRPRDIVLVIDDPISSYDELRRQTVLRMLFELEIPNTVVVLSHDHVFTKYALFYAARARSTKEVGRVPSKVEARYLERMGAVHYLENDCGIVNAYRLEVGAYDTMEHHVRARLKELGGEMTYLQKIIDLRMFYETRRGGGDMDALVYGYLSAILHSTRVRRANELAANVEGCLATKGVTEKEVIVAIADATGISLPPVNKVTDAELIDITGMTAVEKIMVMRDLEDDDVTRAEMSDIIHMNSALVYCLNPFHYQPCSRRIRDALEVHESELTLALRGAGTGC